MLLFTEKEASVEGRCWCFGTSAVDRGVSSGFSWRLWCRVCGPARGLAGRGDGHGRRSVASPASLTCTLSPTLVVQGCVFQVRAEVRAGGGCSQRQVTWGSESV